MKCFEINVLYFNHYNVVDHYLVKITSKLSKEFSKNCLLSSNLTYLNCSMLLIIVTAGFQVLKVFTFYSLDKFSKETTVANAIFGGLYRSQGEIFFWFLLAKLP